MPKQVDGHYGTAAHKDWARRVKQRAKWRCEHVDHNGVRCEHRYPKHKLYADHVIEIRDGGAALDLSNGQCLCAVHHSEKTAQERAIRYR